MNKFSYKILFYILLFFLLIKNIYYINVENFENIFIFFITYILCYFFIDNNLIKILLCITIPDIIYFKPVIESASNMSTLRKNIKEQGGQNLEEHNEKKKKENEKITEEEDGEKVDKKGFDKSPIGDIDEKEFGNLANQ